MVIEGCFESASLRTTGSVEIAAGAFASVGVLEVSGCVVVRGVLEGEVGVRGTFTVERGGAWSGRARVGGLRVHPESEVSGPIRVISVG